MIYILKPQYLVELWLIFLLFLLFCIFRFLSIFTCKIKFPQAIKVICALNIFSVLIFIPFNSQNLKYQYIKHPIWTANLFNNTH